MAPRAPRIDLFASSGAFTTAWIDSKSTKSILFTQVASGVGGIDLIINERVASGGATYPADAQFNQIVASGTYHRKVSLTGTAFQIVGTVASGTWGSKVSYVRD